MFFIGITWTCDMFGWFVGYAGGGDSWTEGDQRAGAATKPAH